VGAGGNEAGNNGLLPIMTDLEWVYQNYSLFNILSRADYWALAGHVAAIAGARLQPEGAPQPNITYLWGRRSCPTSPYENSRIVGLPDASQGMNEVKRVFVDSGLNLTLQQATALIGGAHSMGQTHWQFSGFSGPWKQPQNTFNNHFFIELNSTYRNWTSVLMETNVYQWNNSDDSGIHIMMLNTDMSFLLDIQPDNSTGTFGSVNCTYGTCPEQEETADFVRMYAEDNEQMMADFSDAWDAMLSQESLSDIGPGSRFVVLKPVSP